MRFHVALLAGSRVNRSSENVISTDRAALLWMYCREIAPFETPTFGKNVGELIARATSITQKRPTPQNRPLINSKMGH
jgi:hypothetical protein